MKKKVFIIAEAGVNHNGDIVLAKKLIDKAIEAGVDAVKFQTWKTELLMTKDMKLAQYQKDGLNKESLSQFDMAKDLELTYKDFIELKEYCDAKNIMFLSTPDEEESARFLFDLQDIFKIGSAELNNLPFLRLIGSFKKKIIISTGMSNISQVEQALNIIIDAGTTKENIIVLHANTQYPTPMKDVNLKAMQTIANTFKIDVGYSDHTLGIEVDIAAVCLGATVIEKHFTLDNNMIGPDHKASLEPDELKNMVVSIRNIEVALGDGIKRITESERQNIGAFRKNIVAKKEILKGDILNEDNLILKRSSKSGKSPMIWDEIVSTIATKDYLVDELI